MEGLVVASAASGRGSNNNKRLKYSYCVHATALFTNAPFIHKHVGEWLEDDPYSYFAVARTTKHLWQFYCAYDRAVRHMRYVWNLVSESRLRTTHVTRSGIYVCAHWGWIDSCKHTTRAQLAEEFCEVGAQAGDLRVIRMVAPWIQSALRWNMLANLTATFAMFGYDEQAVHLLQNPPDVFREWIAAATPNIEQIHKSMFLSACMYAIRMPKLYAYLLSLNFIDMEDNHVRSAILVCVSSGEMEHVQQSFGFFWNMWWKDDPSRCATVAFGFLSHVMTQGRTKNLRALPLIYKHFLSSIVFENGNRFTLTVEPDAITRVPGEMLFHAVIWIGGFRRGVMGNVPALYC